MVDLDERPKLQSRLDYLDRNWKCCIKLHVEIRQLDTRSTSQYLQDAVYDSMELLYLDAVAEAKLKLFGPPIQIIPNASQQPLGGVGVIPEARSPAANRVKVQHVVLPRFSGAYKEWPSFSDYFNSLFQNDGYDDLQRFHYLKSCLDGKACSSKHLCYTCGKRHHTLLHRISESKENPKEVTSSQSNGDIPSTSRDSRDSTVDETFVNSHFSIESKYSQVVLSTAWVLVTSAKDRIFKIRALLDSGSTHTFITKELANALGAKTFPISASISVVGGTSSKRIERIMPVTISPVRQTEPRLPTDALIVDSLTSYTPRFHRPIADWEHLRNLDYADERPTDNTKIHALIGADIYPYVLRNGIRRGRTGEPVAINTIFGWVILGALGNPSSQIEVIHTNHAHSVQYDHLSKLISRFWEVEEVESFHPMSEEDVQCETYFRQTHSRTSDGRYVVRIPFRNPPPLNIGDTRYRAERILLAMEKRLSQRPQERDEYDKFLHEYQSLGHMRLASTLKPRKQIVYLPHHHVIKESSSTTKLRVVFNGSAPSSNKISLNDLQMTGPKLQADLPLLLTSWRIHRYVYCADIEKMYRQILVHEADIDYQRILYRTSTSEEMSEFQLLTVTYGTASAPFLALRVLQQLAQDEGDKYPYGKSVVLNNTFVDDCLFGSDTIEMTQRIRDQLIGLLQQGKFELRKWVSNSSELLDDIVESNFGLACSKKLQPDDSLKILGIAWCPSSDEYKFTVHCEPLSDQQYTKRSILSIIARLYDPLGWISPIIITAKIIMQSLWSHCLDWDSPLPGRLLREWSEFYHSLFLVNNIVLPRWIGTTSTTVQTELHGFSDASNKAYAAVIYVRIINQNGECHSALLMSKTRVAPIKRLSTPRLELCGAILLARLISKLSSLQEFKETLRFCWTDAGVVLAWLKVQSSHWKTFVANRVAEVHTLLPEVNWRYIPGSENPADLASRGMKPEQLLTSSLWWHGPSWLNQTSSEWPAYEPRDFDAAEAERQPTALASTISIDYENDVASRFSDWLRLLRITVRILLLSPHYPFRHNQLGWISPLKATPKALIKKPLLRRLNPFLDNDSLLRVGGRLSQSSLPMAAKHPFILKKSHIARLIVMHPHQCSLHGGISHTLSTLRETFWVIQARKIVKFIVNNCVVCARMRAEAPTQIMGSLPSVRVEIPGFAFENCGVDYAGPFHVKMSGGRGARSQLSYVSIFVCLASRAVHLELVTAYTTKAFIAALQRFSSRRGLPRCMYSDHGRNFKGADRDLREAFQSAIIDPTFHARLAGDQISWSFIPPAAPHFGGVWESAVKSMKHHIKRVLITSTPTFEEFSTLLCRIEACLNSRPLAPLSEDVESLDTLTPAHFLIGRSMSAVPQETMYDVPSNRLSRWQLWQQIFESFWRQWVDDYVRSCQHRSKWQNRSSNIKLGQIVLLRSNDLPPTKWKLARVVQCHPGNDGLTRVVTVKTAERMYQRPISKLALLPIDFEQA
ncbi:PREDICTED: uncharacterized protein LOC108781691 [Cyphomyrmex costatus]|uniref:uncharacterized protein LOC108781691 n=1 Tax=Cyphomyrmex costatus TaxID=456900 RepID=UPI00085233EB|nr:PREDICTED: uncharacterized protein LOC108781691 [Cyphomyrmex costatus]